METVPVVFKLGIFSGATDCAAPETLITGCVKE